MNREVVYDTLVTAAWFTGLVLVSACTPAGKDTMADTISGGAQATTATRPDSGPVAGGASALTILFVGTSLTAGRGLNVDEAYPALIERRADSAGIPTHAVNAGVSGETSAGALHRINWVLRTPADVIVIETGANDALRGLPVSAARKNIAAILDSVKAVRPQATVFLVQMEAPPNLGANYTTQFHDMYGDLAREKGVMLMPFLLNGVAGNAGLNQADGLHPNAAGEQIVADNVWDAMEPTLQALSAKRGVRAAAP